MFILNAGALNLRYAWKAVQSLQKEIEPHADKIHKRTIFRTHFLTSLEIKTQTKLFSAIFMILVSMAPYFLQKILECTNICC